MANDIRPKTISFKDGRDLDYIDSLFTPGTRLYKRVPEAWKGNRSKRVRWAIETLAKLYDGGIDNLQAELFEPDSQQMAVVTEENKRLKARILQLESIEQGYVDSLNSCIRASSEVDEEHKEVVTSLNKQVADLERLLAFYRAMARTMGVTVKEDDCRYREKYDDVWIHPAM